MTNLVIRHARTWTGGDAALPSSGAPLITIVIQDGVFAPFDDQSRLVAGPVLDAEGMIVLPGFVDAHVHATGTGLAMSGVDLKGVADRGEVLRRVAARAAHAGANDWIEGAGWDQNLWGGSFPSRHELDRVAPANPVVLHHTSAHAVWVNSAALAAAGITSATPPPDGGAIDRDPDGEPSGVLRDNASRLVLERTPPLDASRRRSALVAMQEAAHRMGLTGIHAMDVSAGELVALRALNDSGELTLRVRVYLSARGLERWAGTRTGDGDARLAIGGIKFFSDGALGSMTAWLEEPYIGSDDTGFPLEPMPVLARRVRWCLEHGLAPAIHAIGDRANREVLDILDGLKAVEPGLPRRIEHAQLLAPGLPERFARLGVHASVQPIHATQDRDKVDRHWGERGRWAYPFSSLRRAGVNLAFGSDSPVETMDPLAGIRAAVLRRGDHHDTPWYPGERVSLLEALHAYTNGPARAMGDPAAGSIAPGNPGDLVVVSGSLEDPMSLRVVATVVAGQVVYRAG